jgi:lipoprotein NlpI
MITSLLAQCYTSIYPVRDSALYYANLTWRLPGKPSSFYFVTMNVYLQYNDYPTLIKTTDSITAHDPGLPYPYNNRGLAKLCLGDIQGAKDDIRISLNLDPTNAWAYRNMGLVFEKMHRPDSSCWYFQMAREKGKKQQYKRDIDSLVLRYCGTYKGR